MAPVVEPFRLPPSVGAVFLLVLTSIAQPATGHSLPRQTDAADLQQLQALNVAPWPLQPTEAPVAPPQLRSARRRQPRQNQQLRQRQQWNTICGFIGGDPDLPATCSAGSHCAVDVDHSAIGCCPDGGPCTQGIFTGCVDKNSGPQTDSDPYVFTCSGSNVCYKNSFEGGYFQYGCGSASSLATSVAVSASGRQSLDLTSVDPSFTATPTPITTGTSKGKHSSHKSSTTHRKTDTTSTHHTKSSSTSTPSSSSQTSSSSSSATAAPAGGSHNSGHTSAIVGGSVGGVAAVLGLIAVLVWYWHRKRGNQRQGPGLNQEPKYISPTTDSSHVFSPLPPSMESEDPGLPQDPPRAYATNVGGAVAKQWPLPEHDVSGMGPAPGPAPYYQSYTHDYGRDLVPVGTMAVGGSPTRMEPDEMPLTTESRHTREIDDFSHGFNSALGDIREDDEPQSNMETMTQYPARRGDGGPLWQQNRRQSRNLMWM